MTSEKIILGIDTSSKSASCAVSRGGEIIAETTFLTKLTHSQIMLPTVLRTLSDCGTELSDVSLFACAAGPGSYTGLRIGIAAIKGLCALGKPCVGVSTLEMIARNAVSCGVCVPVMTARAGVVYFGAYEISGEAAKPVFPDQVGEESELFRLVSGINSPVILAGDCADRLKKSLFAELPSVGVCTPHKCLMSAAGVCAAAAYHIGEAGPAESLNAKYLQNTMAEKLKEQKKNEAKKT